MNITTILLQIKSVSQAVRYAVMQAFYFNEKMRTLFSIQSILSGLITDVLLHYVIDGTGSDPYKSIFLGHVSLIYTWNKENLCKQFLFNITQKRQLTHALLCWLKHALSEIIENHTVGGNPKII